MPQTSEQRAKARQVYQAMKQVRAVLETPDLHPLLEVASERTKLWETFYLLQTVHARLVCPGPDDS